MTDVNQTNAFLLKKKKAEFLPSTQVKLFLTLVFLVLLYQALEEEFCMNQSLMNSVESTCHEFSETPKGSAVYLKLLKELQQLKTKWKTIHTKFSELKDQPGKKLEAEFDKLHGQTFTDLDKIQRGLKKLKLESSEPKNVKNLLDKCVVCTQVYEATSGGYKFFPRRYHHYMKGIQRGQ